MRNLASIAFGAAGLLFVALPTAGYEQDCRGLRFACEHKDELGRRELELADDLMRNVASSNNPQRFLITVDSCVGLAKIKTNSACRALALAGASGDLRIVKSREKRPENPCALRSPILTPLLSYKQARARRSGPLRAQPRDRQSP